MTVSACFLLLCCLCSHFFFFATNNVDSLVHLIYANRILSVSLFNPYICLWADRLMLCSAAPPDDTLLSLFAFKNQIWIVPIKLHIGHCRLSSNYFLVIWNFKLSCNYWHGYMHERSRKTTSFTFLISIYAPKHNV